VAAITEAAETAAVRQVAVHAEANSEADRTAALPMADTITANRFFLASPHTSLTVRRLRKGPPVLPKYRAEMGKGIASEGDLALMKRSFTSCGKKWV
jgi:hypothetical protein